MKGIIKKLGLSNEKIILRAFTAWCCINLIIMLSNDNKGGVDFSSLSYAQDIKLLPYLSCIAVVFILLMMLDRLLKSFYFDPWLLIASFSGLAFKTSGIYSNYYYAFFITVPIAAVLAWLVSSDKLKLPNALAQNGELITALLPNERSRERAAKLASASAVCIAFGFFLYYVGTIGVLRYKTFSSPNFDFGIFVNMFHNMKETGLPLVTCERDKLLSHFAVHISPIYYLLLPIYAMFPTPETLQISQALVLASGVIPLYLICRKYALSRRQSVFALIVYTCLPSLSAGTFYDLHENCFLTPLLLWVFYFFEKEKPIPMYAFAVLTLTVKEDAAVYIAVLALYAFFSRRKRLHGAVLFAASVLYFYIAVTVLERYGEGAMSNRYSNYIYGDSGFIGIISTCLKNPLYIFTQLSVSGDGGKTLASKLLFILQMLVPLGFIPFITKKISRYILLLPFLLINLMPLYQYQYDIGFQYAFGSSAFLLWLFVMNIADMKNDGKRISLSACAVASALVFSVSTVPTYDYYKDAWTERKDYFEELESIMQSIDPDASLTVSTMLLPHLADRAEIYEVHYHDIKSEDAVFTEYVVIDMRSSSGESFSSQYLDLGIYEIYRDYENLVRILVLKDNK